ncbi:uncharacterized protein LOC133533382 [Cydia pomonella]|uniref:uncharacterized protein LOC133533382 n=1 Tax=Cydia pomonella TaxID=82600 RepID=UPI002ADE14D5|nr:uncharacterized protein LOC133533382 [Cydia pomonella]XP_061728347.1 uncharacterized protein LOC133533382 [Cydia pomonella]XP_061728352.1 uncharacterized protein LOC133533382 [Cydia pomonella]XP_061728360.1 uncharacterized protein LOC133533382 [Cydia pomonella]XP_061728366.1 uncharacterized protein LOC133533382 [Cydia pomonella]XP_061728375.1 uncharacterized protein LOC133533382 [Cydia pomonella]
MYTSMCFMSIVAILMIDVRTGALLQKDTGPRQCYQCLHNQSACQPDRRLQAPCPAHGLHCATVAKAPDFTSTLTCAASAAHPCTLTQSQQTLQLTCTCAGHRCNSPFTAQLRNKLLNFTLTMSNVNKTSLDLTDMFLKYFGNVSLNKLYEAITLKSTQEKRNNTQLPVYTSSTLKPNLVGSLNDINPPRAEALKHEATEPSDDEEDENEGSGSYEESRLRRPASAPAAPSSYLPANENKAPPLFINFILITTIFLVML